MKVSVIVPIYNSEKYLKKCLDSLVNQKLKDMEFILINDGSTDNSLEIIKSYQDSRIRYFEQENMGIGAARNRGIKEARGLYIGFLDSDDYVLDDTYLKMYNKCIRDDLDIVICDYFSENGSKKEIKLINFSDTTLEDSPNLLMDIPLSPWNKLYKKDLFTSDELFPVGLKYEDTPFVTRMFSKAKKIGKLSEPLFHYVIHSGSETTVIDKRVFDIFKICDILERDLGNNNYVRSSLDDLIIYLITKYTISMRYVRDSSLREKFLDEAFKYLNDKVPKFKKSNYFKKRNILKKIIEENKNLTKLYCNLYIMLKNVK